MARQEIDWKERRPDGIRRQVKVRREGGGWVFYEREKRFDSWERVERPTREDWECLLEAVQRRIRRNLLEPREERWVRRQIQKRFPESGQ